MTREQSGVKAALAKRYGAGLNFTFAQNPALIGGMRIKVGSDVFDGSIQSRLAQLAGSLKRFDMSTLLQEIEAQISGVKTDVSQARTSASSAKSPTAWPRSKA